MADGFDHDVSFPLLLNRNRDATQRDHCVLRGSCEDSQEADWTSRLRQSAVQRQASGRALVEIGKLSVWFHRQVVDLTPRRLIVMYSARLALEKEPGSIDPYEARITVSRLGRGGERRYWL